MNRINKLFKNRSGRILSVYFTAGYPVLNSTVPIIKALSDYGADMIEIGVPFSDPVADGPVIQHSNSVALKNGISLKKLIRQLTDIRDITSIPLLLMSYLNPVLHYGVEELGHDLSERGVDGVIIPDLPVEEYNRNYKKIFAGYDLKNVFLVTPQTPDDRVRFIDREGDGFLYVVSSRSTTGIKQSFSDEQMEYFSRLQSMHLKNNLLAGFGISNRKTFDQVGRYLDGAIVGSGYIKALQKGADLRRVTRDFIRMIKGDSESL